VPSAEAVSVLLDLLGPTTFADEATVFVNAAAGPLSLQERTLVQAGALKAALLVATEVREFAYPPEEGSR
jgi:hypothetical protein